MSEIVYMKIVRHWPVGDRARPLPWPFGSAARRGHESPPCAAGVTRPHRAGGLLPRAAIEVEAHAGRRERLTGDDEHAEAQLSIGPEGEVAELR
jgi:hypothetical protein